MYRHSIRAASVPLALTTLVLVSLVVPLQAQQASGAPTSDDSAPPITVQIAPPPISISSAMLGVSSPLGAQSVPGKPMLAEFVTEHHQNFTDGNRISHSTTSNIYRDAQGRIRRESQLSLPGMTSGGSTSTFITIVDHKLGFGYVLDPQEMVAHRYELNGVGPSYVARLNAQASGNALGTRESKLATKTESKGSDNGAQTAVPASAATPMAASSSESHWSVHAFTPHRSHAAQDSAGIAGSPASGSNHLSSGFMAEESGTTGAPDMRINQPFLAAPNPVRTENLGEKMILGFRTKGTRVITTLPAGQIGNDRPIDIISEQWFSPDLELVMRSMHRDPWAGEFITTVTKISQGDQPTSLFEIPQPYRVIDAANEGEHHVLDGHGSHSPGPAPW